MKQSNHSAKGTLYIVATPIGHLGDMVPRAVEVLQMVDLIAAEDTRHSGKLLQYFDIQTNAVSYHDYSGEHKVKELLNMLSNGQNVALISDAGTPLISDPGFRLVADARQAGIQVVPIPGACAVIAALSAAGLPSDRFLFEGFTPAKSEARKKCYEALTTEERTTVFYESPHRIIASLEDLHEVLGAQRKLVMARELTKTFETFIVGTTASVLEAVLADSNQQRGEMVLLVGGCDAKPADELNPRALALVQDLLAAGLSTKAACKIAASHEGEKKNALYRWTLDHLGE